MQENITKMRGAAADVFMYLYCKIPYIYVHLLTLLVKVCSFFFLLFLYFFFLVVVFMYLAHLAVGHAQFSMSSFFSKTFCFLKK
jgi:hypothetical protein